MCLFLNKASLEFKRYHLLPQEAGSCLAQGHNYSFIIKMGSHGSAPPSPVFGACGEGGGGRWEWGGWGNTQLLDQHGE